MANKITGCIIHESFNNGKYSYTIVDRDNGQKGVYGYFCNGNLQNRLSTLYEVTITYNIVEKYGKTFYNIDTVNYGALLKNTKNLEDFLTRSVKFTKTFAKKVMDKFGDDTIRVLIEEPQLLESIIHRGKNVELEKVKKFTADMEKYKMYSYLSSLGIKSKYHERIINTVKYDKEELKRKIYEIKIPFGISDEIGMKMGYEKTDPNRIKAFNKMIIKKVMKRGDLYITKEEIEPECVKHNIPLKNVLGKMVKMNYYYTSEDVYKMEKFVEDICLQLATVDVHNDYEYDDVANNDLDPSQGKAIEMMMANAICIVNGGAGTGKTYTLANFANKILDKEVIVFVLAPTGAAVERIRTEKQLEKILDISVFVSTIHSFLMNNNYKKYPEINKSITRTLQDSTNYDEIIICIDEMSMVDLKLFYKLLVLLKPYLKKVRLIILGDYNQLPSIGGGNVLRDMIDVSIDYNIKFNDFQKWKKESYSKIKYICLQRNHRQLGKKIYENGKNILNGDDIVPDDKEIILIEKSDEIEARRAVIEIITKLNIDFKNSCVITPVNSYVDKLNIRLQKYYNENGEDLSDGFKINDKVMYLKNDKGKQIYNGSILLIKGVDGIPVGQTLEDMKDWKLVEFKCEYFPNDNGMINGIKKKYKHDDVENLKLAYSFTVHKSQGKGYDDVIIVIHSSMGHMLNKNSFYTALTRAKKRCIIISDKKGLEMCKRNMPERVTGLFKNSKVVIPE